MNILEIANTSGGLGEKMAEEKLVRKILRSLPKRFAMKVTAIEEAQDICKMKVDELIGSLQTFEMGLCEDADRKNKSIAFVSNTEEKSEEGNSGGNGSISEAIAMLGRQFNKFIKKVDQQCRPNVKNIPSDIKKRSTHKEKANQGKGIQCHGCEGYGHIKAECPTFLKMQRKGLSATWSEEDTESESEGESAKHVTALTSVCGSEDDSSGDELNLDELAASYKELCVKSAEVCIQGEKQKKLIKELESEKQEQLKVIEGLNGEISLLTSKLDQMTKSIRMLSKGSDTLEEILKVGQKSGTISGLGFTKNSSPELKKSKAGVQKFKQKSHPMSQHQRTRMSKHQKKKFQRWRCHYCGRFGHIKPFCYRLHGYPNQTSQGRPKKKVSKHNVPIKKQTWAAKQTLLVYPKQHASNLHSSPENQQCVANLAYTSSRGHIKQDWYLDSGCSRHMTGMNYLVVNLHPSNTKSVTLSDGTKREVMGVGKLDCPEAPKLSDVLLVKGLTVNLISISQLCDQGYKVEFTKGGCVVLNGSNQEVMRGDRSKDNCYLWKSKDSINPPKCPLTKGEQEGKVGHGKRDAPQVKGVKKSISKGTMRRASYLSLDKRTYYGNCLLKSNEPLVTFGHHTTDMTARDRQRCMLLMSAETQYLACGGRWSPPVWRNLMQTEYNVTQNVMTLYSKDKKGRCASEKL
jgi:hypothetical protein